METEKGWRLEEYKRVWTFSWMPRLFLLYCMAFSLTTLKSQLHKRRHAPPETGPVSSTKLFWKDLDMLRRRKRKTDLSAFPSGINLTYCRHVILLHCPLLLFPRWPLSHSMQIFKPQHIHICQGNNYSHWLEYIIFPYGFEMANISHVKCGENVQMLNTVNRKISS